MAKKIFRLHQDTKTDDSGWFVSAPITSNDLDTIITDGKGVATSIPSPFARIDLVKSAFKWVANNNIDGQTAHHKLVSDTLDIAQLFFLSNLYSEITIIEWNPNERLQDLINSPNHKEFGETLLTFWQQDGKVYNFNNTDRLFFILYNEQLVGGTSPATLFFSAPDANADNLGMNINRGNDRLLDNIYASLANREWSFIEYMFALSKSKGFRKHFTIRGFNEVDNYLDKVKGMLSPEKRLIISQLDESSILNYDRCHVSNSASNYCDLLGIPLGLQIKGEIESDFVLVSDHGKDSPLILPHDKFSQPWSFTSIDVKWDGEKMNKNIPYKNVATKENSRLPVHGDEHYWLTIGNFLEEKIIELPYTINSTKFQCCGSDKYLLPLTSTFFEYFKTDNISKYLKLEKLSSGVQARLEIPVKGGKIKFKKIYNQEDIEKVKTHVAILPFFKTKKVDISYTIGVLDSRVQRNDEIEISCFYKGNLIDLKNPTIRRPGEQREIKSLYYQTSNNFDAIQLKSNNAKGYILPMMKEYNGNDEINYSIDFGTTNTHIEYKEISSSERAFEYTSELPLWQSLIDNSNQDSLSGIDDRIFESEMMPYQIDEKAEFNFPLRTAIAYNNNINFSNQIDVFKHTNNYLLYEKRFKPKSLKIKTSLKWSNYSNQEDQLLVESYIEYLMLMTLYKTLSLGGDPAKSTITWFYPVSMDSYELNVFSNAWVQSYKNVYQSLSSERIKSIPESIAPYLYYKAKYPGLSLSIDIGGGSSDIALFEKEENNPILISSFKFAGNAIFGDGFPLGEYRNSTDNNGFVKTFLTEAKNAVNAINNEQKKLILDDIINSRKDSSDFSSFLFALENENGVKFSYTKLLQKNKKMKLSVLIFYGAVAYYSAKLLKKSGLKKLPNNILFSGTAAKSMSIIDPSDKFENISAFFKYMFENIISESENQINVALEPLPKEITCKGALKASLDNKIKSESVVFWIGAEGDDTWAKIIDKEKDIAITPKYSEIDSNNEKVGRLIEESIEDFYNLFDGYINKINLNSKYGIDAEGYELFKQVRSKNIASYLKRGLDSYHKDKNRHIEETLFFYPLIGMLNNFSYQLSEN